MATATHNEAAATPSNPQNQPLLVRAVCTSRGVPTSGLLSTLHPAAGETDLVLGHAGL
jgi:hypothetical protein